MSNLCLKSSIFGGFGHCSANDDISARIRFSATPFCLSTGPFFSVKLCLDPSMTFLFNNLYLLFRSFFLYTIVPSSC